MGLPDIMYARNGDVNIAYQVVGQGPTDLVLVSGFVYIWRWPGNLLWSGGSLTAWRDSPA